MTMKTEKGHAWGFLISEAAGHRARDNVTVLSGQTIEAGEVVGKVTGSGKYVGWDPAAVDGSQTVAGIMGARCDATAGDQAAAIVDTDAEVIAAELVFRAGSPVLTIADARAGLLALGIKAR
jgi:hypothetical protein